MFDVLIVGMGPAGVSAALYACRANLSTAIVGKDLGALTNAEKIENYYGLPAPVAGETLAKNGIQQARALGATFIEDEVLHIEWNQTFIVQTKQNTYESRTVILATGTSRKTPKIKGLAQLEGHGVSFCSICDAFFYRGKEVAVLGHSHYALHEIEQLLPVAGSVTLLTNGLEPAAEIPESVRIDTRKIEALLGEERLAGVQFQDGEELSIEGLFVALGSAGGRSLAQTLGAQYNGNYISVSQENMSTNVPGLFAAGDCTGGTLQVSKAVGEGALAAMSAIGYLRVQQKQGKV